MQNVLYSGKYYWRTKFILETSIEGSARFGRTEFIRQILLSGFSQKGGPRSGVDWCHSQDNRVPPFNSISSLNNSRRVRRPFLMSVAPGSFRARPIASRRVILQKTSNRRSFILRYRIFTSAI